MVCCLCRCDLLLVVELVLVCTLARACARMRVLLLMKNVLLLLLLVIALMPGYHAVRAASVRAAWLLELPGMHVLLTAALVQLVLF